MKKISLLSALAVLAFAGNAAASAGDFYFKGGLGYGYSKGKIRSTTQSYRNGTEADGTTPATPSKPQKSEKHTSDKSSRLSGAVIDMGVGYNVSDEFRTEFTITHGFKQNSKKVNIISGLEDLKFSRKYTAFMLNGYYDFKNSSDFTPYIGAGLGYISNNISINADAKSKITALAENKSKSKKGLGYSLSAGVAYKISESVDFDLGYTMLSMKSEIQFFDKEAVKAGRGINDIKFKLPSYVHMIKAGVRVKF